MPDDAAFATAIGADFRDALDEGFNTEGLLIASGNLSGLLVEKDEVPDELQEPVLGKQTDQELVLLVKNCTSDQRRSKCSLTLRGLPSRS